MTNSNIGNADFSVRTLVFGSNTHRVTVLHCLPRLRSSKSAFRNIRFRRFIIEETQGSSSSESRYGDSHRYGWFISIVLVTSGPVLATNTVIAKLRRQRLQRPCARFQRSHGFSMLPMRYFDDIDGWETLETALWGDREIFILFEPNNIKNYIIQHIFL